MRPTSVSPVALVLAFVCAAGLTAAFATLSHHTPLLKSLEHWTADWRSALLADRAPTQHPRLAVVVIDDDTLQGYPYRSPIDRRLLARLIEKLDTAGARVIGLDFLFDQPTEPDKDREFIDAIRKASGKVVLGTVGQDVALRAAGRTYLTGFLRDAGATAGTLNLRYEIDRVVRGEADIAAPARSFAATIAEKAGVPAVLPAPRIAWLGTPADGSDALLVLAAGPLVSPADEAERKLSGMLLAGLKDRIVLVGADLADQADRHPTPLAKLGGGLMPGVLIHAQAVAQRLDGRRLDLLDGRLDAVLVFAMAFAGFVLGWMFLAVGWVASTLPVVILALIDVVCFAGARTIVPFAAPALAWLLAVYIGRAARWSLPKFATLKCRDKEPLHGDADESTPSLWE